jgi:hypothetical protein
MDAKISMIFSNNITQERLSVDSHHEGGLVQDMTGADGRRWQQPGRAAGGSRPSGSTKATPVEAARRSAPKEACVLLNK